MIIHAKFTCLRTSSSWRARRASFWDLLRLAVITQSSGFIRLKFSIAVWIFSSELFIADIDLHNLLNDLDARHWDRSLKIDSLQSLKEARLWTASYCGCVSKLSLNGFSGTIVNCCFWRSWIKTVMVVAVKVKRFNRSNWNLNSTRVRILPKQIWWRIKATCILKTSLEFSLLQVYKKNFD